MNAMRQIRLDKLTINIGAGDAGPKLEKGQKIIKKITGGTVMITKSLKRSTFGVAKGRPIGAMTTLRGPAARQLLEKLLLAVEGRLKKKSFDSNGNFSFGIKEYINIPGIKYDPDVGILGMDVCVTLRRPGYRVKDRMIRPASVGKSHRIKPEEAQEWAKKEFGIKVD
jgi:large subunit ribosomal protein L5